MTALTLTGRAEWRRIWSVRSSWLFALATAAVVVGFAAIIGSDAADDPTGVSAGATAWDGGRLTGMFALFGIVAFAVVTSTADHVTGGIVPTLQWTPRRGVLLAARGAVVTATLTGLGLVLAAAASVVVWLFVPDLALPLDAGMEKLGGLAFIHGCGALLGVGLGLLTRSTANGLVGALALLLVLPLLLAQLPYDLTTTVAGHLPGSGALFLIFGEGPLDDLTTTSARVTLATWAVGALGAGGWRLLCSDADR